uniref:Uncharacterized protein n=1 Tax=Glossina austeni TaxID=7395 RepID=A0A1A9VLR1_GLOAU
MANNSSTEAEEIHTIFGSQNNSLSGWLVCFRALRNGGTSSYGVVLTGSTCLYVNSINDVKEFATVIVVYVKVHFDIDQYLLRISNSSFVRLHLVFRIMLQIERGYVDGLGLEDGNGTFLPKSNLVADHKFMSTIGLSLERSYKKGLMESEKRIRG